LEEPRRRSWLVLSPAVALVGLGLFVVGRFWLTDASVPPAFGPLPTPALEPLPGLAERPPGGPRLAGTLLAPEGTPVEDALVYASPAGVPTWDVTDAAGRFELPWPPTAALEAAPSFVELSVAAWGYPSLARTVDWGLEAVTIELPPREPPTPRLPEVETAPATLRARPALARPQGAPLELELVLEPVGPREDFSVAVTRRVRCEPDGSFRLEDLAHGRYRARVLPGWAAGGSWPDLAGGAGPELTHSGATEGTLELPLSEGALAGVLTDPEGEPLEGALALLTDSERPERLWPPRFTDARGRFRFDDLPAGTYRLVLSAGEGRHVEEALRVEAGEVLEPALPALAPRAER
jgi:hypothetical protein